MSPEHGPSGEDTKKASTIVAGCTMDNQIIFDVLSNALHASRILKMSAYYQDSLQSMLNRLAPMQIGKYNQLQEWLEDLDNPNDKHRHISHVYGLFPSNQISPYTHPLLFQAAKNTLPPPCPMPRYGAGAIRWGRPRVPLPYPSGGR